MAKLKIMIAVYLLMVKPLSQCLLSENYNISIPCIHILAKNERDYN